tara:strand:+ start:856 stop:1191 length:336 start_codon:yes stop_codon:yes gene_type:complete
MNKASIRNYLNNCMTTKDDVPILTTSSTFAIKAEKNAKEVFIKLSNMNFPKVHIAIEHCVTYFTDDMSEYQIRKIKARSLHRLYSDKATNKITQVVMLTICDRALWEIEND